MKKNLSFFIFLLSILVSCDSRVKDGNRVGTVAGFVPIYSTDVTSVKKITAEAPRNSVNGGKIYTVGNLLFQVEVDSGIHIINYANPSSPQKLGFIKSFLCKEVSVKNGFIYTNNLSDLVVIDINNPNNIHEAGRIEGVFPDLLSQYPPKLNLAQVYFECADPKKGFVVSWKQQMINNPKCWR